MKKLISSVVCAVTILSCFSMSARAVSDTDTKLPFTLEAPSKLSLSYLNEQNSLTTMNLAYSMNDSMCKWMSEYAEPTTHDQTLEKLKKEYKLNDIYINSQIDWAIDDPENGWHYTAYWDGETFKNDEGKTEWAGFGKDKEFKLRTGEWDIVESGVEPKSVNEIWILRGIVITNDPSTSEEDRKISNEPFYGNELVPGLKNQLKDDQYSLVETDPETHNQAININYEKHNVYVRMRWAITLVDEEDRSSPLFSEWSEYTSYGKDSKAFEPLKKEDLAPPVISNLKYYPEEFNGYPQIACTLDIPQEIIDKKAEITANGGEMRVEWEARIPGGEWIKQQADEEVTAGENIISLLFLGEWIAEQNKIKTEGEHLVLEKDSPVELRAHYWCNQKTSYNGEEIGEFYSDYSKVLTFGSQEMSKTIGAAPSETEVSDDKAAAEDRPQTIKTEKAKCFVCGICPVQPLGICLFIWIAVIVLVIVIVTVVIIVKKKKKNE